MRLWDLPGARRFIDNICDVLRAGSSVVIQFSDVVPEGFDNAIASSLGNAFRFDAALRATQSPFDQLRNRYADEPEYVRSLADLCDETGFRGRLIRLEVTDASNWPAWRDFLTRYAQASRSRALIGPDRVPGAARWLPAQRGPRSGGRVGKPRVG